MKTFTDIEIFNRLKGLPSYKRTDGIPLIVGIQSNADVYDEFDDKFFLYDDNNDFVLGTSGTTNSGSSGLKDFIKYNPKGVWVWDTDIFYPKLYRYGLHKGKMRALRQDRAVYGFRDGNKNEKNERVGQRYFDNVNANFHGVDYDPNSTKFIKKVGGWSVACQVVNDMVKYKKIIDFVKPFEYCDYAILKEF